jgi:acetyl esterase/lipase
MQQALSCCEAIMRARYLFVFVAVLGFTLPAGAQPAPGRTKDVIYGRRDGHALTMDVNVPRKPNGAGVILCISAGFESTPEFMGLAQFLIVPHFTNRGYTVFSVLHSSQPRYTVPEILDDMHRAVRFIKANAKEYGVKPEKLGIAGASSGGHLSLMMGCAWREGNPKAADEVEQESSKVAAVACFFPVTDFVEFDAEELPAVRKPFRTLFDIRRLDPATNKLERITAAERREIGRSCSPVYCARDKKNCTPTFIIHGDADDLVPVHQTRFLFDVMKECGAACEIDIIPGMGHDPKKALELMPRLIDWLDKQLLDKK